MIPDRIATRYFRSLTNENFSIPTVLDLRLPDPDFSSLGPFGSIPVIRATVFGKRNLVNFELKTNIAIIMAARKFKILHNYSDWV